MHRIAPMVNTAVPDENHSLVQVVALALVFSDVGILRARVDELDVANSLAQPDEADIVLGETQSPS